MLAKDYKASPNWKPERSDAGSKAAILAAAAAGEHRKDENRESVPPSMWGTSAATIAFRSHSVKKVAVPAQSPNLDRERSLRGAHGAIASNRRRAISNPQEGSKPSYPDEANAAANALSAATIAAKPAMRTSGVPKSGAVPYTTMNRDMFTSHPPVKPEVDEQKRNDVIHASAVAMAKRMYNQQQRVINATKQAHSEPGMQSSTGSETTSTQQPMQFTNLQEAAYKLAQERLAKLHAEHQQNREFQEYYGSSPTPRRSLTLRNKMMRRRSSSDGDVTMLSDDRKRSQEIRQQMSLFSSKLSQVDEQKRQKDREALMAAARRNVEAQLQGIDKKVAADTGMVPPSSQSPEWESRARAEAHARSMARRDENAGKIDIGGGKYMDRAEVDEIAAKRVQPMLDDITEKAEKERERQAALRLEEER